MKPTKKILTLAICTVMASIGLVENAMADLSGTIPSSALSDKKKKVTICHFPPGNPTNYQVITISKSALDTHFDHHDDVFAVNGVCPAIATTSRWQYLKGPGSWNPSTGKPNTLTNLSSSIPSDLLAKVLQKLPEGQSGPATALITNDAGANVKLIGNATVKVSYITEGAGYVNSVGFFSFNPNNINTVTKTEIVDKVMFPNFSNNVLSFGDAVDLGSFTASPTAPVAIGFTIIANGWKASESRVNETQSDNIIFRSIRRLNPESATNNLNAHTVLLSDPAHELLVLGFEDLNRANASYNNYGYTSDNDFNDVVIAIHVSPFSAVDTGSVTELGGDTTNITPVKVSGQSGPTNWREVTSPDEVVDTIKAAKKTNGNGNGNGNNGNGNGNGGNSIP